MKTHITLSALLTVTLLSCATPNSSDTEVQFGPVFAPIQAPPKFPGPQNTLQWTSYTTTTTFTTPAFVKGYLAYATTADGGPAGSMCPLGVHTPGSDLVTVVIDAGASALNSSGTPGACLFGDGGSQVFLGATF